MFTLLTGAQAPTQQETLNLVIEKKPAQVQQQKVEPVTYTVQDGDTLTSVAEKYQTTWIRLWNKNTSLTNQDSLAVGTLLTIPTPDETLADRPLYTLPAPISPSQGSYVAHSNVSTAGNAYSYGYCTWYVKNVRPDMPNNLGNADTWYVRYGGTKGSTPSVGAVAVAKGYMHVAIVTGISGGNVTVTEMNYAGWNVVSTRTTSASEFLYLY